MLFNPTQALLHLTRRMRTSHTPTYSPPFPALVHWTNIRSQHWGPEYAEPLPIITNEWTLQKFSLQHQSTCCVQISWNLADRKSVKSCITYVTERKISSGSTAVATARIAPKICQCQPPTVYSECSRFHLNRFTFSGVIAKRINTESNVWMKPSFQSNNNCMLGLWLLSVTYLLTGGRVSPARDKSAGKTVPCWH